MNMINANQSSAVSKLRSYVLNQVCGNRDMGKEEAMRLILSLPGKRSNVYFNKISLDSNRLKKGILKKENANN